MLNIDNAKSVKRSSVIVYEDGLWRSSNVCEDDHWNWGWGWTLYAKSVGGMHAETGDEVGLCMPKV